jgi:hypothetical protein
MTEVTSLRVGDWVRVESHNAGDQDYEGHVLIHEASGSTDQLVVECPNGPTIRIATLIREYIRRPTPRV